MKSLRDRADHPPLGMSMEGGGGVLVNVQEGWVLVKSRRAMSKGGACQFRNFGGGGDVTRAMHKGGAVFTPPPHSGNPVS